VSVESRVIPGEVNCIFTKVLIPFVEENVGPEGVAAVLQAAGRSREWLIADHNWISLALANRLVDLAQKLMGEADEERWARRFSDFWMDWKPTHEERSYLGAYTIGFGSPRAIFENYAGPAGQCDRWETYEVLSRGRRRLRCRWTPRPGYRMPRWVCVRQRVQFERYPTNWGLPRARVVEHQCAATGADSCVWDVHWTNPPLGLRFWGPTLVGGAGAVLLWIVDASWGWLARLALAAVAAIGGAGLGFGLLQWDRRQRTRRLLEIQREEILHSNKELERKFRDLESKIEQLSLLIDLSGAVNATLDPEKIYEQALTRLVHGMGYEAAYLFLVDEADGVLRGHRMAAREYDVGALDFQTVEVPRTADGSAAGKVAVTGLPVLIQDVEATAEPVLLPTARAFGIRSLAGVPLRVKDRIFGVVTLGAREPGQFTEADVELLAAVANHVALAVDRAESFQTIEELSRGLEDKVRVRTEQLRAANEELQVAYRDLQATQMQLIQREKMASVGQLVAGVAHELNNPIGFVFSNVTTLEDFVGRLRGMLDSYRARSVKLPEDERSALQQEWETRKVDYALRYLDSMIQGIREGAERTRKIVRDLRVFARTDDDAWQPVDVHEELESSLTLLNHLLKDRITVRRQYGALPSVECIRSQIDQVFLNLLANAAQAITGPGQITIETRPENGLAAITISDTGPGIEPHVIGRIFDPFFTTKSVGEGTGLGLSISYEIVKKHGGEIQAESRPGEGATFTVKIPASRAR
jgi:signal transduction histidine kinase